MRNMTNYVHNCWAPPLVECAHTSTRIGTHFVNSWPWLRSWAVATFWTIRTIYWKVLTRRSTRLSLVTRHLRISAASFCSWLTGFILTATCRFATKLTPYAFTLFETATRLSKQGGQHRDRRQRDCNLQLQWGSTRCHWGDMSLQLATAVREYWLSQRWHVSATCNCS